MSGDKSRIPICHSDFLQDVSIELGRRLKTVRYSATGRGLEFQVSTVEFEGESLESFGVINWLQSKAYIQVVVLENGRANYVRRGAFRNRHDTARYEGYVADLRDWTPIAIADLMRDSLKNGVGVIEEWCKIDIKK